MTAGWPSIPTRMWPRTSTCRSSSTSRSTAPRSASSSWASSTSTTEPVLPQLVAALRAGAVVRGAGRSDVAREALADTLHRAGLVERRPCTADGRGLDASGPHPGRRAGGRRPRRSRRTSRTTCARSSPRTAEPRRLPLDVDPRPQPASRRSVRAVAAARLPEGSRSREVAKAGLTTYREARKAAAKVREAWVIPGALEPKEPSYAAFLRRHDSPPHVLDEQRLYSRAHRTSRPRCTSSWSPRSGRRAGRHAGAACASRPGSSGRCPWSAPRPPPTTTAGSAPCPRTGAAWPSASTAPSPSPTTTW